MPRRAKTGPDGRVIELTQGHVAIVDARDYDWLTEWRWRAQIGRDRYVYAVRQERIRQRRFHLTMHQLIIGDVPAGMKIHHINKWGLDNRRCNLIVGPPDLGEALQGPAERPKTSQYKGVYLCYRTRGGEIRWAANITVAGKHIYLGVYEDEIEAAQAHDLEAIRYYGPHAYVNFPEKIQEYLRLVRSIPAACPATMEHGERDDEDLDREDLAGKAADDE